ncbi:MAG: ribonuclease Z [Crocinitomicaceae bacterium]|nr:ribonuclease Z [Crocinitomicaceae bacterium]
MNFAITILGSGSAVPTSRRNPTGQYIECNGRIILIDCGEGTQMQLRKLGMKFQKIQYILISHLHGDHYFGLVGLLSTMHLLGRTQEIKVFGPVGLKQIIEVQLEAAGSRLSFDVNVTELEKGSFGELMSDEKISIHYFPLRHKIPTSGFKILQKQKERKLLVEKAKRDGVKIAHYHRLKKGEDVVDDEGRTFLFEDYTIPSAPPSSYAFCSDTAYSEDVVEYIKEVDLLYHEATFTEEMLDRAKITKHSTAKHAGQIAKMANVKRLIMGHLSARYDNGKQHVMEAKPYFENCSYVEDGDVYQL